MLCNVIAANVLLSRPLDISLSECIETSNSNIAVFGQPLVMIALINAIICPTKMAPERQRQRYV